MRRNGCLENERDLRRLNLTQIGITCFRTGCIDLETNGTLGYCSIFNSLFPRRSLHLPFLGLAVGGKAWTLTTHKLPKVDCARRCLGPSRCVSQRNRVASQIGYSRQARLQGKWGRS